MYIAPFLFFMFSLLIGYTLYHYRNALKGRKHGILVVSVMIAILISATVLNLLVYNIGEDGKTYSYWMEDRYFSSGVYMRHKGDGYYAHGDWYNTRQVAVGAKIPYGVTIDRGYGHVDRFDYDTVRLRPFASLKRVPDSPFIVDDWHWENAYFYNGLLKDRLLFESLHDPAVQEWIRVSNHRYMIRDEASQIRLKQQSLDVVMQNPSLYNMPEFFCYKIYRNEELAVYYL